jgi:hypothetical protein
MTARARVAFRLKFMASSPKWHGPNLGRKGAILERQG